MYKDTLAHCFNRQHTHTLYGDFSGCPVVKTLSYNAGSAGSISGRGAEIPHASRPENQNIKQKQFCNKFNKDFENGPHQKKKKILKKILCMPSIGEWLQIFFLLYPHLFFKL